MPRLDMLLSSMIDDVTYAKRTLRLQHTFETIAYKRHNL